MSSVIYVIWHLHAIRQSTITIKRFTKAMTYVARILLTKRVFEDAFQLFMIKGNKPQDCDACEKSFAEKTNLESHKSTVHINEKPLECTICNKFFKQKKVLNTHMNIHYPLLKMNQNSTPTVTNVARILLSKGDYKDTLAMCMKLEKGLKSKMKLHIHFYCVVI